MAMKGNKYGSHRVIEPKGVLTQAAWKVDNDMTKLYSNEIICNVTSLNVDSASFTQIEEACGGDEQKIGEMIMGIVAERGKQQNPVTGSGGMFKGEVAYIGEDLLAKPGFDLKVGDKIVSLVSLSMTPLKIEKILAIHKDIDRVDIVGKAILFESALYAQMSEDMSEPLALAANDGKEYDLSICCVNIESCEMSAILPVRDNGRVYFFSMATSFTKAALGAEGVGKDVEMIIGNGYTKNHAEITLNVLRESEKLRKLFDEKYV